MGDVEGGVISHIMEDFVTLRRLEFVYAKSGATGGF